MLLNTRLGRLFLGSGKQVMIFERAGRTRTLKNHYTQVGLPIF